MDMVLEMAAQMDAEGGLQILAPAPVHGFPPELYNAADWPEWVVAAKRITPTTLPHSTHSTIAVAVAVAQYMAVVACMASVGALAVVVVVAATRQ